MLNDLNDRIVDSVYGKKFSRKSATAFRLRLVIYLLAIVSLISIVCSIVAIIAVRKVTVQIDTFPESLRCNYTLLKIINDGQLLVGADNGTSRQHTGGKIIHRDQESGQS